MSFFLSIFFLMSNTNCYKICKVSEIEILVRSENRSLSNFDTTLPNNHAFVYYLKTGKVALTSSGMDLESDGLLFDNISCFQSYLDKNHFPIKNENEQVEERYQNYLLNLPKEIDSIIYNLVVHSNTKGNYVKGDSSFLSGLLNKVKADSTVRKSEKKLFFAALTLGEYLRITQNGNWLLLKRYGTFNPYYTPAIIYPDGTVLLFWDYLMSFFNNKEITCLGFANLPYIKSPRLKYDSPFITNNFVEIKKMSE